MVVASLFFYIGGYYEYARRMGTFESRQELAQLRRELEQSREMLYNLTHHAAFSQPRAAVTAQPRRLTSVKD